VAVHPLVAGDKPIGVAAVFDRRVLEAAAPASIRQWADLAAPILETAQQLEAQAARRQTLADAEALVRSYIIGSEPPPPLVAGSVASQRLLRQLEGAAGSDAPVLISGEPGSGKTLLARWLHAHCGGPPSRLVPLDCSTLAPRNLDALLEALALVPADNLTTLLFEEVSALSPTLQARLMGLLDALGPAVRIVASTSSDLRAAVDEGRFDAALYYRLSVVVLEVPPLRDRGADIVSLAETFAGDVATRLGAAAPLFTREATEALKTYVWPGNVAELAALVERAVRGARGGAFRLEWPGAEPPGVLDKDAVEGSEAPILTRAALRQHERASIEAALRQTGGRVFGPDGAAVLLGMKPTTLASRIKALGVRKRRRRDASADRIAG